MSKVLFILHLLCLSLLASSQSVDFTFQGTTGFCNPATIQFTQQSTGSPTGFIWTLGNGLTSYDPNPSTSYTSAGTYTVTVLAIYPEGSVQTSRTITILPAITTDISVDRNFICKPGIINLSAASSARVDLYAWDFGDGVKVNSPANGISHTYTRFGSFNVVLRASDSSGCFARDTIKVEVKQPPIIAKMDTASGCLPLNVNFQADVTLPLNGSVSSYAWDFGDGTAPVLSPTGNISYSYTTTDSVRPSLIVTTNEGCSDTVKFRTAAFGNIPGTVTAYAVSDTVCGSETLEFVAKAENATGYKWDFGDGTISLVKDTLAKHQYTTLGTKKV